MKKLLLSLSLLCSIPVYAMQQTSLDASMLKTLKEKVEEEKKRIEEYKKATGKTSSDCVHHMDKLLQTYHQNSEGISDLSALVTLMREYDRLMEDGEVMFKIGKEGIDVRDVSVLIALYEGMQQAADIHEKVKQTPEYKTAIDELLRQKSLTGLAGVLVIHNYMIQATTELEKDNAEKILLKHVRDNSTQCLYNYTINTPCTEIAHENAKIKKLTTYYLNMVFAEKAVIEIVTHETQE